MRGYANSAMVVSLRRCYPSVKGYHHPCHESIDKGKLLFVAAIGHGIIFLIIPMSL